MTKFSDQLFDDLMREHGPALAHAKVPVQTRHRATGGRMMLAAGGGGVAVAAAVAGTLVAGGGTPAYAVTTNPNGTITLAVYQKSGIAQANAKLRELGDKRVVVVPIEPGCPRPSAPAVSGHGHRIGVAMGRATNGSVTVSAHGIPAGDILAIGVETGGHATIAEGDLTSAPAPDCLPAPPTPPPGIGGHAGASRSGTSTTTG